MLGVVASRPNARRVSVVGDFNNWDGRVHELRRMGDSGVFALFVPGVEAGALYKYDTRQRRGVFRALQLKEVSEYA